MSLTRQHFYALARFAADEKLNHDQIHELAALCKRFNSQFKKQRFYDAIESHRRQMEDDRKYETGKMLERIKGNG